MNATLKNEVAVCVTGASGYFASYLVKLLLLRGYTVHATVRDPNDGAKTEHLKALEGAKERLHLFRADLMEEGSFDAAIAGCEGVFHTASPVNFNVTDPQKWYAISKILAEEAAWKFSKENGINMVSMNPGTVIGPMLQPTLNESVALILNLVNGAETYPNLAFPWVHIEDVAEAHIRALIEIPSAHGRYCLVESVVHHSEVIKLLHKLYPTLHLPNKCADDGVLAETYQVSKTKAKSLGIDYIPLEVSLKDTVERLKEKKLLEQ